MATSTETFRGAEGVTVTVTIRTSLMSTDAQWQCTCGLSCDDGVARGRSGTTVNTVKLKQAAARHAAECTGIWEVEH